MKFAEYRTAIEDYVVDEIIENYRDIDDSRENFDNYHSSLLSKGILQQLNVDDIAEDIGPVLVSDRAKKLVRYWTNESWDGIMNLSAIGIDNVMTDLILNVIDINELLDRADKKMNESLWTKVKMKLHIS